jgi:hypothetical protein
LTDPAINGKIASGISVHRFQLDASLILSPIFHGKEASMRNRLLVFFLATAFLLLPFATQAQYQVLRGTFGNGGGVRGGGDYTSYDVSGAKVRTLVDAAKPVGRHVVQWDGKNENGSRVGSGVYSYRLTAGKHVITKKLVIIR